MELLKPLNSYQHRHKPSYIKILRLFTNILSMKTFEVRGIAKIDSIESKLIKALRDTLFPELTSLEFLISLISSIKHSATKFDISLLANLLCDKYAFFQQLRDKNQNMILSHLVSVLSLEHFEENDKIIVFEDIADKFYIILDGTIGIYRPQFCQREMSMEAFCNYLYNLKYSTKDLMALERIENKNETYNDLVFDINTIKLANYQNKYLPDHKFNKKEYYIEENFLLAFGEAGMQIGDMAFLANTRRNATIISLSDTIVASISKENYCKIIKEIEYKELVIKTESMQRDYFIFQSWSRQHLIKIMNFFSTVSLLKGELLYNQNDQSDYIYFSQKGLFECYTNISLESHQNMVQYINDPRGDLLKWIRKNYFNNISRQTISQLIKIKRAILNKIHLKGEQKNNNKIETIHPKRTELSIIDFVLHSKKENQKKRPNSIIKNKMFKVKIRKINVKECFGIEEAFDCKTRFSTIECISPTAEVVRINILDLIQFICEKRIDLREISMLIEERKQNALVQLNNFIRFETKQAVTKTEELSRNNQLSVFGFDNNNDNRLTKNSLIRITNTKFNHNLSAKIIRSKNPDTNIINNFSNYILNSNISRFEIVNAKEAIKSSLSTSQKSIGKKVNVFSENKVKRKNVEEKKRIDKEKEKLKMMKYITSLKKKNYDSLQKEIFYMAGFHKINRKKIQIPTEEYEKIQKLSPQEKTITILNSFQLKSRNEPKTQSHKKTKLTSIRNFNKNTSALSIFTKRKDANLLICNIKHIKPDKLSSREEKFTQCE